MNPPTSDEHGKAEQPAPDEVSYFSLVRVYPILRYLGWALGAGLFLFAVGIVVSGGGPWWMLLIAALFSLFVSAIFSATGTITANLDKGVLKIHGLKHQADVPMGAIAYVGRAEFDRRSANRMSRLNMVGRAGPGLEIVARDASYVTVRVDDAEELMGAMAKAGAHPGAFQRTFPVDQVDYKHIREVRREQRGDPSA